MNDKRESREERGQRSYEGEDRIEQERGEGKREGQSEHEGTLQGTSSVWNRLMATDNTV